MKLKIQAEDFNYKLEFSGKYAQNMTLIICSTVLLMKLMKTINGVK